MKRKKKKKITIKKKKIFNSQYNYKLKQKLEYKK